MKLKLVSAPPLMLEIDGEKRAVDISFREPGGQIVALPTARRASPIVVGHPVGGTDAWQAWCSGFEVAANATAQRIAAALMSSGAAQPA